MTVVYVYATQCVYAACIYAWLPVCGVMCMRVGARGFICVCMNVCVYDGDVGVCVPASDRVCMCVYM